MSPSGRHIVIVLVVVAVVGLTECKSKPKPASHYFNICSRSDPELNECVRKAITAVRPTLVKGIPALGLVPIEPLVIPRMALNQGSGNFQLKTTLTNFTINGLSKYNVTRVNIKFDDKKFVMDLDMRTPQMLMTAGYEMAGQILVIPVQGKGNCELNFTDVSTNCHTIGKIVERNGKKYFDIISIKWDIIIHGKSSSWFYNLFNGDKQLGDATNSFLNNNSEEAFLAYKHLPEEAFGEVFKDIVNRVYEQYPIDELFSP